MASKCWKTKSKWWRVGKRQERAHSKVSQLSPDKCLLSTLSNHYTGYVQYMSMAYYAMLSFKIRMIHLFYFIADMLTVLIFCRRPVNNCLFPFFLSLSFVPLIFIQKQILSFPYMDRRRWRWWRQFFQFQLIQWIWREKKMLDYFYSFIQENLFI